MIDAIIFDLDGTLVDSTPGIEYAAVQAWETVKPGPPAPALRPLIGPPIREILRQLLPEAHATTIDALHHTFRNIYDTEGWKRTIAYPSVAETLTALNASGVECFGATYKPSLPTQHILEQCGLRPYFRVFLSPDSVSPPFTSKTAMVETLLAQYSLDQAHTLLVGDTASDALAAETCGLRFVAFAGGFEQASQSQFQVETVCSKFADLLKLIQDKAA